MSKMMLYAWQDTDGIKFGEHYSESSDRVVAREETVQRIRNSWGARKHQFNTSCIVHIWDATDYAIQNGCCYAHARCDDFVRSRALKHRIKRSETHANYSHDDFIIAVNNELYSGSNPREVCGLAKWQHDAVKHIMESNSHIHVVEACARFGKTIFTCALARELNIPLTIIASYVLTSHPSFKKELSTYEQFRGMTVVDTHDDTKKANKDWRKVVDAALADNKQVVVLLSLVTGANRQSHMDFLFNKDVEKLLVVDEADYGAHQENQAIPLINAVDKQTQVILMTGTNADRASNLWLKSEKFSGTIDYYSVMYPELVYIKRETQNMLAGMPEWMRRSYKLKSTLKHFGVDYSRHLVVSDVKFYQADMHALVEEARHGGNYKELFGDDLLPSWTKAVKDVNRAQGIWSRLAECLFLGVENHFNLHMAKQLSLPDGPRYAMMFTSSGGTNAEFNKIVGQIKAALPGWIVVGIVGNEKNSNNENAMKNENAEAKCKEQIENAQQEGKNLLLISKGMASRSFSIGELTEIYLCYDRGDAGATVQKISRGLTPNGTDNKVCRVVSLSFDPNRDDNFDAAIMQSAKNIAKDKGIEMVDSIRLVLNSTDINMCQVDGAVQIDHNAYIKSLLSTDRMAKVIATCVDFGKLTMEQIEALAGKDLQKFKDGREVTAKTGKTYANVKPRGPKKSRTDEEEINSIQKKAREFISELVDGIDIISIGFGCKNIADIVAMGEADKQFADALYDLYAVDLETLKILVIDGVLPIDFINLRLESISEFSA